MNTNVRVVTERGSVFLLRVNEGKSEADVRYEAAVVARLASRGIPTPAPVRTRTSEPFALHRGKLISLFPWIVGHHVEPMHMGEPHVRAVGEALARLHVAGRDFPDSRAGLYTLPRIAARFATFARSGDPVLSQAVRVLGDELERLPTARAGALPEGIIHQDLFRDNVLFGEGDALVALLDFEQAVWGRFAYDLAVCLLAWCFRDGAFDPRLCQGLVSSYERIRPLGPEERAGLAAEARLAGVRFTVTRISDVYLRPQGAPQGKDFRSYLRRLQVLRESGLPLSPVLTSSSSSR